MTETKKITLPEINLDGMRDIEMTFDESNLRVTEVTGINGSGGRTTYSDLQNELKIYQKTVYYAETDRKKYECRFYEGKEYDAYTGYHNEEGSPKKITGTLNPNNPEWFIGRNTFYDKSGKVLHDQYLNDNNEAVGAYMEVVEGGDIVRGTKHSSGNGEWVGPRTTHHATGYVKIMEENFDEDGKKTGAYSKVFEDGTVVKGTQHPDGSHKNVGHLLKIAADGKTVLIDANFNDKDGLTGKFYRRFGDGFIIDGTIRPDKQLNHDWFINDNLNVARCNSIQSRLYSIWKFTGPYRETWEDGNVKWDVDIKEELEDCSEGSFLKNVSGYFYESHQNGVTKRVGNADKGLEFEFYPDGKPKSERVVDENGKYEMTLSWSDEGSLTVTRYDEKFPEIHVCESFEANSRELFNTVYYNGHARIDKHDLAEYFPDQSLTKNKLDITQINFDGKTPQQAIALVPKPENVMQ